MSHVNLCSGCFFKCLAGSDCSVVYIGMFVDTYFKIACSFTSVNLITSTRASVYYVRWMNVFVFEFEESFDLACLPKDMEVKFPFVVFVKVLL